MFGRKRESKSEEAAYEYEVFGGLTITRKPGGYEIVWRSPNITTINVQSIPVISEGVQAKYEGDVIHILTNECKLRLVMREGRTEAYISKI